MAGISVFRVRSTPGGTDADGDPVAGTTSSLEIDGCMVAPRQATEPTERGRAGVIVGLTLYAPLDTDLVHTDRIEIDGVLYEIDGEPGTWRNPWKPSHGGVEVALRRAVG